MRDKKGIFIKFCEILTHGLHPLISAKDDKVVPTWMSENLAKKLNAKFIQTPNGGHFMESEGFKDLPLVIEELERIK